MYKKIKSQCTNEAYGSAYEGVEVATSSVDVGLGPGTALPPRQTAEQDGFSNHYLLKQHTCQTCLHVEVADEGGISTADESRHVPSLFKIQLCPSTFAAFLCKVIRGSLSQHVLSERQTILTLDFSQSIGFCDYF